MGGRPMALLSTGGLLAGVLLYGLVACSPGSEDSEGSAADVPADRVPSAPAPRGRMEVGALLGSGDTVGFERAMEPRPFVFPADHGPHPGFRTEWWYVTGHLTGESGRRFGYQLTIFRAALSPERPEGSSGWRTNQAYMAHFAVTDEEGGRFLREERFARGALGLAGARGHPFRVWLEDWWLGVPVDSAGASADPAFPARLVARTDRVSLDLVLDRGKDPVLQRDDGLSPKGPGRGNASFYYSLTRMPTEGRIVVDGDTLRVEGASWMDREWSTSALGPGVEGWDWFALQLEGGRELMYYRLRRADGSASPRSGGVWVEPDGRARILDAGEVEVRAVEWWESPEGGTRYPVSWEIRVPSQGLGVRATPVLADQEWRGAFRYWEGAVVVDGTLGGNPVAGRGYLELTGYE